MYKTSVLRPRVVPLLAASAIALSLAGCKTTEGGEQRRDRALLAERGDANGFEGRFIAGSGDLLEDGFFKRGEVGHGKSP